MPLWIPITLAAAFLQNLRSALQRYLTSRLDTAGATYVRFLYGWPVALIYLWLVLRTTGGSPPVASSVFFTYCAAGGMAQIAGTALLIKSFSFRNFVVGTTYSKTEIVQTALFGLLILGDTLSFGAGIAILVSLLGVVAISVARTELTFGRALTAWTERPALLGLGAGAAFGMSAVSYRAASLSLGLDSFVLSAAYTLAWTLGIQTVAATGWLLLRNRAQLIKSLQEWRAASLVGLAGALGSIGWFSAMTLENAAHVRALGQVELVFAFMVSVFWFKERANRAELLGITLILTGILGLLLAR